MTKIDERAIVPEVDAAAKRRLAERLNRSGVVGASLIGSQARGDVGPLSDIDVGVWLEPGLSAPERAELANELAVEATSALETSEVDLVILNDASPLFRHRAIRDGERLLERSPVQRVRLETRALLEYLDTAPLRETLAAGAWRRAALVDAERLGARLARLERLIEELEKTREAGLETYLAEEPLRMLTERRLQLAVQACIDIGVQLVSEMSARAPTDYADVFSSLAEGGFLDRRLAQRLGSAAGQRNVLVHDYLDIDDQRVFVSLSRLDDLREFGEIAQRLVDAS